MADNPSLRQAPTLYSAEVANMASEFKEDPFREKDQVSSVITPQQSWQFYETHGFFYQRNEIVGALVHALFAAGAASKAYLPLFQPQLSQDERIMSILTNYPYERPDFHFGWGGLDFFYSLDVSNSTYNGIAIYAAEPGTSFCCCDQSQKHSGDGEWTNYGPRRFDAEYAALYRKVSVDLESGGL
ncbi:hypothetical protein CCM_09629 [Cordyceps militaris CM01]|uniref:Uncharacterized protein n=1 Tax=Cordyceps militaris (strain CM01) TaxID=983644 RepID=G3JUZ2_CORMM|nr:uncharacterized protein CCM_09629 [Cordyceps militaris CM01]EGX87668.1 hypothetical protein CCM_09629 [Cordyceps militaris CM01]